MRVTKTAEDRKAEIIETANRLFLQNGYDETSIADIIREVDIAKGTFYYYFASKEALLDEIIEKINESFASIGKQLVANHEQPVVERLKALLVYGYEATDDMSPLIDKMHEDPYGRMHMQSLLKPIEYLTPYVSELIVQGIAEGVFVTEYPEVAAEMILIIGQLMFDGMLFKMNKKTLRQKAKGFTDATEKMLGTDEGTFAFLYEHIMLLEAGMNE